MEKKISPQARPPIVAVLGHVDHGKTTLLDKVRETNIQAKEVGGITQSIGASVVITSKGRIITFIDTPGHAAFAAMRSRGVNAADMVILVVAADDGVKPQTKESLKYILKAKIPFLVVLTKVDLPTADISVVKSQLEKEGILFEGRGGNVPVVCVSARSGKGIDELLETIILLAEVNGFLGTSEDVLEAVVIETQKSKAGSLVSVVVKKGILRVGNEVVGDSLRAKIRGIFDSQKKQVKTILPGYPGQVLGFSLLPSVGCVLTSLKENTGRNKSTSSSHAVRGEKEENQTALLIKADSSGALEAVLNDIPPEVYMVDTGVGDVSENDISMAKNSQALIFTFNLRVNQAIKKLALMEGVKIEEFNIIYKIFERIDEIIKGKEEKILGRAQIIAEFPFNDKRIAGCKVIEGVINKGNELILFREGEQLGKVKVLSLKKAKQEVDQVKTGEEYGILFVPQLDFKVGDDIVYIKK